MSAQIFLSFSEKALARQLELLKCFMAAIVQHFLLLTMYDLSYILFIGHKCFLIEKYRKFQSRAVWNNGVM